MGAAPPQSGLRQLFNRGRELAYQKDDIIIRPGDTPSGVYYIVSGWVKVYTLCRDGEPNIIMSLGAGEAFPMAWAVSGIQRDIGFAALDSTKVRRISQQDFTQALKFDSSITNDVLRVLAGYFFALASEVDNLQYRSAREKVVFRLVFLANNFGRKDGSRIIIATRVTNDYIARSTNMTRETASRELSRLSRKQLIRSMSGQIIIPDLGRLCNEISRHFNPSTLSLD